MFLLAPVSPVQYFIWKILSTVLSPDSYNARIRTERTRAAQCGNSKQARCAYIYTRRVSPLSRSGTLRDCDVPRGAERHTTRHAPERRRYLARLGNFAGRQIGIYVRTYCRWTFQNWRQADFCPENLTFSRGLRASCCSGGGLYCLGCISRVWCIKLIIRRKIVFFLLIIPDML